MNALVLREEQRNNTRRNHTPICTTAESPAPSDRNNNPVLSDKEERFIDCCQRLMMASQYNDVRDVVLSYAEENPHMPKYMLKACERLLVFAHRMRKEMTDTFYQSL